MKNMQLEQGCGYGEFISTETLVTLLSLADSWDLKKIIEAVLIKRLKEII